MGLWQNRICYEKNETLDVPENSLITHLIAALLFCSTLYLYAIHAATSVQYSDGAEYATASITGTIIHPPGYPLYSIVTRAVVSIFSKNPYHTLALLSSLFQAFATTFLFYIGVGLGAGKLLSLLSALVWATYGPSIRTGTDTEVFALHHLLITITVLCGIIYLKSKNRTPSKNYIYAGLLGLSLGFAVAHHHTIILWVPFYLFILYRRWKDKTSVKEFITEATLASVFSLIPCSLYLLLLTMHTGTPVVAFVPPQNLNELFHYIARTAYGSLSLTATSTKEITSFFVPFVKSVYTHSPLVLISLPLILLIALKKEWGKFLMVLSLILLHGIFAYLLKLPVDEFFIERWIARFYPLILMGLIVSFFIIISILRTSLRTKIILASALLLPATLQFSENLEFGSSRSNHVVELELELTVNSLPQNAVFFAANDHSAMGLAYFTKALSKRTDIKVVTLGLLNHPGYFKDISATLGIDQNKISPNLEEVVGSLYSSGALIFSNFGTRPPTGYITLPVGAAWQWIKATDAPTKLEVTKNILAFCANWPEEITSVPRSHRESRRILGNIFIWPIKNHLPFVKDQVVVESLNKSIEYFMSGNLRVAKEGCENAYLHLTKVGIPAVYPYNNY